MNTLQLAEIIITKAAMDAGFDAKVNEQSRSDTCVAFSISDNLAIRANVVGMNKVEFGISLNYENLKGEGGRYFYNMMYRGCDIRSDIYRGMSEQPSTNRTVSADNVDKVARAITKWLATDVVKEFCTHTNNIIDIIKSNVDNEYNRYQTLCKIMGKTPNIDGAPNDVYNKVSDTVKSYTGDTFMMADNIGDTRVFSTLARSGGETKARLLLDDLSQDKAEKIVEFLKTL